MPGVDIDRSFYGAAPELVNPQRLGLTDTGATKESDIYAFGVLVWEVSPILECLTGDLEPFLRFSRDKFHSPM